MRDSIARPLKAGLLKAFFTNIPIDIGATGHGTGLGLGLSYDIVKAHGGEIKVESNKGKGAEFIIHIPIIIVT